MMEVLQSSYKAQVDKAGPCQGKYPALNMSAAPSETSSPNTTDPCTAVW